MPDVTPPINPFKKTIAASKRASTFGITAIVLAILAGVLAWFAWNETHRITQAIKIYAGRVTQTEQTTIATLQKQINTLQNNVGNIQNKLDQLTRVDVQAHNQRAFSEASYLIHMANLQLAINRNADSALQLMKLAHEQLKQITNLSVAPLKHAVAQDVVSLENTSPLDVAKLLAKLDQLKIDVQKLPELPTQQVPTLVKPTDTQKTEKLSWYKKLGKSFSGFKDLVIIRHEKKPIKPLLSPQQLTFLKQNIQLKISEAEWAVLYQNPTAYQQSLQSAQQMLETYYPNQALIANTLKDIQSLSKINIKPTLPDLSNTLKVLSHVSLRNKQ